MINGLPIAARKVNSHYPSLVRFVEGQKEGNEEKAGRRDRGRGGQAGGMMELAKGSHPYSLLVRFFPLVTEGPNRSFNVDLN